METLAEKVLSLMEPQWNVTIYGKVEFKISQHLSNNSSYELHLHTGLFFMKIPLWGLQRSSLRFKEDI